MKLKLSILAAMTMAAGCTSPTLTQESRTNQADVLGRGVVMNSQVPGTLPGSAIRGSSEFVDALAAEQAKRPVLRRSHSTYIGSRMVPVTAEDKLPSIFRQDFTYVTDDARVGRTVTLNAIANRIYNRTGIPVRIQSDVDGLPINPSTQIRTEQNGNAQASQAIVAPLEIDVANLNNFRGTLGNFIATVTDRLGLAWEYRDGSVVIMRFVTESFEVSAFMGKTTYTLGSGTAQGKTSQSSDSQMKVTDTGDADAFVSLEKTIRAMVSPIPGSDVVRADGSKRLMVKTTKETMAKVRDFFAQENATMQKQALIQFDVYSVQTNDQDERSINWNIFFNSLSNVYGITNASPSSLTGLNAAQLGISILKGNSETSRTLQNSNAILNMLNQVGSNAQHRVIPMVALNGTWATKSRLNTESYISETTPGASSAVGAGAPGIKTDKVTTGDQYQIMPQILSNNSVMLKMGMSLSDLLGLTDQTVGLGVNQQKVQTTKVSSNDEQFTILLKPGEVMSITGLSRVVSSGDQRALSEGAPVFFGGSRKAGMMREHFVVFVRPVVL